MLQNIVQMFRERKEQGSADMIAALAITPIVIFLLIGTLNAGIWMNTKSQIEAATRDGARLAAMWGGSSSSSRLNNTGSDIDRIMEERLWNGSSCIPSHCSKKPNTWCNTNQATAAGQKITCRVRYWYKSIPGAQLFSFVPTGEIVSEAYSYSETGFR